MISIKNCYRYPGFFSEEVFHKLAKRWRHPITREYPNLAEVLTAYRQTLIKNLHLEVRRLIGQFYCSDVPVVDNYYYEVIWGVREANRVIKDYRVPETTVELAEIIPRVDLKEIDVRYLPTALRNCRPITLALYPQLFNDPRLFVIDGNHRAIAKSRDGQTKISAYILSPHQHLKAMTAPRHRILFKIHFNYIQIARYMCSLLSLEEVNKSLLNL